MITNETISNEVIRQSNHRAHIAIVAARIDRNPATISEVRDALNARRMARERHLTTSEEQDLAAAYLNREGFTAN